MKKFLSIVSILLLSCVLLVGCKKDDDNASKYKVAMITDYGDITDQSFNQATYEGCKEFCDANGVTFKYYKPASDSDDYRIAKVEEATSEGYNVIVMPGYAFANTIKAVAKEDECCSVDSGVKIIALDVSASDLGEDYELPENVYCAVYQEEIAGYFAGYAAVMEGYKHLGFLGGMAVPAVVRYGYGFVQGCDAAAQAKNVDITINYTYGGQFYGDADITGAMTTWYNGNTEIVFCCGGGIYTSAAQAAVLKNLDPNRASGSSDKKIIGVDVDQSYVIAATYGNITVTSAMKGLSATVKTKLAALIKEDKFVSKIETLGLVSATDVESNFVQLPIASWSMTNFKVADYKDLVAKIYNKTITVSNDTDAHPTVSAKTTVDWQTSIK